MVAAKYIPNEDELMDLIQSMAVDGFGPSIAQYDRARPDGWVTAGRIRKTTGINWSVWLRRCGLKLNNPGHGKNPEFDEMPPRLERIPHASERGGLSVMEQQRPVKRWDWQRKTYTVAGWRTAQVVR